MATPFKLKSGNKTSFKEMGSSPLKAPLAEPEYHYTPDVPSEVIIGSDENALDPAFGNWRADDEEETVADVKETEEDNGTDEGVVEKNTIPQGTGEKYKSRKQRRADKQYHKEQARAAAGPKKWWQLDKIGPEQRRRIKQNKLEQKQTEARSKGTVSYGVNWSLGGGLQEGVEPKADRLQRRIDKLEEKEAGSELSKTKAKTETLRKERKGDGFLGNLFKRK